MHLSFRCSQSHGKVILGSPVQAQSPQKLVNIVDHVSIVGNAAATDIVGIVDIVDIIDIVDIVEAIWNNARLCNNQSKKCD